MRNSCLYECTVMHHRLQPSQNKFEYRLFMFSIELDELEQLDKSLWLLSYNRRNLFAFRDRDHLQIKKGQLSVKKQLMIFLKKNGVSPEKVGRIQLITHLCTFGYQFNPVSFYYCYDQQGLPLCSVAEVSNTYREMKLFFLSKETFDSTEFRALQTKHFYVSPFTDLDTHFNFRLGIPSDTLQVHIDDYQSGKRFFLSTLAGKKKPLTNGNLLWYAFRFPFVTVQVMILIHWQALKLWLRRLPYHKKTANAHLQLNILKPQSN